MALMAEHVGDAETATRCKRDAERTMRSVRGKLYNEAQGYFRAKVGEDRVDTVASVFGALYLLEPVEAARVEETLSRRVGVPSGLRSFDPPYRRRDILIGQQLISVFADIKALMTGMPQHGVEAYHSYFVWPWVSAQNIHVKLSIALKHPEEGMRERYKREAISDLVHLARMFKTIGGAPELVDPYRPIAARIVLYTPPKNFMGSLVSYQSAYQELKRQGWTG